MVLSRQVWVMLGAAGACLAIFFATIAWVFEGANVVTAAAAEFDRSISLAFAHFRETGPTGRVVEISALGSAPALGIFAVVVYSVIIKSRDWVGFAHLTTTLLAASVLSRLLQHVWDRPRPETLLSYISVTPGSFPSAHLFGAAACYATFAFFYARYARDRATAIVAQVLAALLVMLIGSTRVYLGAHHTTDVIAGIAGGWALGLLIAAAFSLWYPDPLAPPHRR
jgi:membrane-associated phospholipid phosphatase